jgi:hypothetical protein
MEEGCDCEVSFMILKSKIEIFYEKFKEFYQHNIINRSDLQVEVELEEQMNYIIHGLDSKIPILKDMEDQACRTHTKYIDDIKSLLAIYEKYKDTYTKEKQARNALVATFTDDLDNANEGSQSQGNDHGYSNSQLLLEEEEIKMREYREKEENKIEFVKVKGKIIEFNNTISTEISGANETIEEIDNNVERANREILRTNEHLRQAALIKNKKNTIKYPLIIGGILGVVGSVVPGIGNIIGATIGASLGFTVAKVEKKCIEKVEPEKCANK